MSGIERIATEHEHNWVARWVYPWGWIEACRSCDSSRPTEDSDLRCLNVAAKR